MQKFEILNLTETDEFGKLLGRSLFPGSVILLNGEMGIGKTTLTKSIAKGLRVEEPVTSPTFTIIQEYSGVRLQMYHIDTYRLEEPEELLEIGIEEYLHSNGVTIVEWPELMADFLPNEYLSIFIERTGEESRIIRLEGIGESYLDIIKELVQCWY